jgi:hypothetical protein
MKFLFLPKDKSMIFQFFRQIKANDLRERERERERECVCVRVCVIM